MSADPPDTHALERAELQKSYSEKILSTNRFIVSTLIILIVLAIVVEQELREHRQEERDRSKQVQDTSNKLLNSKKELVKKYRDLKNFLKTDAYEGPTSANLKIRVLSRPKPDQPLSPIKISVERTFENCRLPFLCGPLEDLPEPVASIKEPNDLEKLRSGEAELKQGLDRLEDGREKIDSKDKKLQQQQLDLLNKSVSLYRDYARVYADYSSLARNLLARVQEKKTLDATKRSIPTPFGSFEVQPRLALFALAFATLFSYFAFLSSVFRIRALAKTYYDEHPDHKTINGSDPAPFWLYSTEPELSRALTWRNKLWLTALLSLALQAGWVLLAGLLTWECLRKWKSVEALLFNYRRIWVYALLALLVIATIVALWQFVPGVLRLASRTKGWVGGRVRDRANRRAFVGGAIATVVVALGGGGLVYWLSRRGNQKTAKSCGVSTSQLNTSSSRWEVVNNRTRVVHHATICFDHLPEEKNRVARAQLGADFCVHKAYQSDILERLAKSELSNPETVESKNGAVKLSAEELQAERKKSLDKAALAAMYLRKAVELKPLSYHLYDKLIRIYGRLKRYEDIAKLLQEAQQYVQAESAKFSQQTPPTAPAAARKWKRKQDKWDRAKDEFDTRVRAVKKRESAAADARKSKTGPVPERGN